MITLTTDFGTADGYVGEMKGVIASLAPGVPIVDITHDIPPQDVDAARLVVERCWERFPEGTVHIVVVDPVVGTARAPIAARARGRFLVGPDNGVLSAALAAPGAVVVRLEVPEDASATFHGRDVFAPAAARLARGEAFEMLGPVWTDPCVLRAPAPFVLPNGDLVGEVLHADRFGNAVTNIVPETSAGLVEVAGRELPLARTYADVEPGAPLALVGSSGCLEIAIRNGHAARTLGLTRGSRVVLRTVRR